MLSLDQILGQQPAIELLRRMLDRDRLPQALLFHGPEGIGKLSTARAMAATLLCENAQPLACGRCPSCHLVVGDAHPDLIVVGLLPKTEAGATGELRSFILISQIRRLSHLAALTPRRARRRVFIIDPAERMNLEAQNALLKTLEEPPGSSVLILIAARPHMLLPTVRSRCLSLGFAPLRISQLAHLLEQRGMPAEEAAARAALAGGRVGAALGLDLDHWRARREELLGMLEALAGGSASVSALPSMAAAVAGRDEPTLLASLDLLQALLRDAARTEADQAGAALVHFDLRSRLVRLGTHLGFGRSAALVAGIERLREGLLFNTNRLLTAECLLAAIAGGPLP